jgi:hypothetical protein
VANKYLRKTLLGVKFSVRPSILLNSRECSPLGVNKGVYIPPRGQISPLGTKFIPKSEVHPWGGGGGKLRMALWRARRMWIAVDKSTKLNSSRKFWTIFFTVEKCIKYNLTIIDNILCTRNTINHI